MPAANLAQKGEVPLLTVPGKAPNTPLSSFMRWLLGTPVNRGKTKGETSSPSTDKWRWLVAANEAKREQATTRQQGERG
jgi:hypothetical protein